MAADPALATFLDLSDDAVAAYADARAEALGLPLPPAARAGVIDNLTLLRRQAETFIAALPVDAPGAAKAFEP
ncbi:AtzG-like protein [Caulobacter sp. DWR2-3-1b2]|uniref:AtzG-like protein n=1 Tax=unclassified Caulobacter TaxID=2648921 RepID=UPI0019A6BF0F|nr:DUF4089 domain-containing protein [Caulobacter sp.]